MKDFMFSCVELNGRIQQVRFGKKRKQSTSLELKCKKQIEEYLLGQRKIFDIPLLIEGTDFQKRVWREMMNVPYGETISYKELAARIGKPKAYRAAANACGKNSIPIIIPCHRITAGRGIGGYSSGTKIKKTLLDLEQKFRE